MAKRVRRNQSCDFYLNHSKPSRLQASKSTLRVNRANPAGRPRALPWDTSMCKNLVLFVDCVMVVVAFARQKKFPGITGAELFMLEFISCRQAIQDANPLLRILLISVVTQNRLPRVSSNLGHDFRMVEQLKNFLIPRLVPD